MTAEPCPRCRAVQRGDTSPSRSYGALTEEERGTVLRLLNTGHSPDHAAKHVGRTAHWLLRQANTDAELHAALNSEPLADQRLARLGDFLAAFVRNRGNGTAASREINAGHAYETWAQDDHFAAALAGLRAVVEREAAKHHVVSERLDRAAEIVENGGTLAQAAQELGTSAGLLYKHSKTHPRLAAAVSVKYQQPMRQEGWAENFTEMWNSGAPITHIAEAFGVSTSTVQKWRRRLGLPARPTAHPAPRNTHAPKLDSR